MQQTYNEGKDYHSFNIHVAKVVGIKAAIIAKHLKHWHLSNQQTGSNLIDGHYWTYDTVKTLSLKFTYLTVREIGSALKKLEKLGYLLTGNYNKFKMDRTKWYALTEAGCTLLNIPFHKKSNAATKTLNGIDKTANDILQNGNTIPHPIPHTVTHPLKKFNKKSFEQAVDLALDEGKEEKKVAPKKEESFVGGNQAQSKNENYFGRNYNRSIIQNFRIWFLALDGNDFYAWSKNDTKATERLIEKIRGSLEPFLRTDKNLILEKLKTLIEQLPEFHKNNCWEIYLIDKHYNQIHKQMQTQKNESSSTEKVEYGWSL